jgi:crotonobetainyl-CoA:carnitine CoA-transferase CaiB-like acyl-CoA transferase
MMTGTVVDPIAAEYSTFVALAAIRRKQLTGEGGEIEVPLCDIAAQLTAKAVVHASAGVEMPTRQGCRHPHFAPQGMYLAADLRWVAISVASDKQWAAFGTLPEAKSWAADERFAALAGRQAHHDELDERVRAMCSTVAADELVETLRALGVPAAPLGVGSGAIADRQLLARGRVFTLEHKVFGPISYLGPAMRYSHTPVAAMPWATPVFGEHNYEVLSELGYSRDEIQALLAAKSIGDSPFGLPFPR